MEQKNPLSEDTKAFSHSKKTTLTLLIVFGALAHLTCFTPLTAAEDEEIETFHTPIGEGNLNPDGHENNDDHTKGIQHPGGELEPTTSIDTAGEHTGDTTTTTAGVTTSHIIGGGNGDGNSGQAINTTAASIDAPLTSAEIAAIEGLNNVSITNGVASTQITKATGLKILQQKIARFFKKIFSTDYKTGLTAFDNSTKTMEIIKERLTKDFELTKKQVNAGIALRADGQAIITKAVVDYIVAAEKSGPSLDSFTTNAIMQDPMIKHLLAQQAEYLGQPELSKIIEDPTQKIFLRADLGLDVKAEIQEVYAKLIIKKAMTAQKSIDILSPLLKNVDIGGYLYRNVVTAGVNAVILSLPKIITEHAQLTETATPEQIIAREWVLRCSLESNLPEQIQKTITKYPFENSETLISRIENRKDMEKLKELINNWQKILLKTYAKAIGLQRKSEIVIEETEPDTNDQTNAKAENNAKQKKYDTLKNTILGELGLDIRAEITKALKTLSEQVAKIRMNFLEENINVYTPEKSLELSQLIVSELTGNDPGKLATLTEQFKIQETYLKNLKRPNLSKNQRATIEQKIETLKSLLNAVDAQKAEQEITIKTQALNQELAKNLASTDPTTRAASLQKATNFINQLVKSGQSLENLKTLWSSSGSSPSPELLKIVDLEEFKQTIIDTLPNPKSYAEQAFDWAKNLTGWGSNAPKEFAQLNYLKDQITKLAANESQEQSQLLPEYKEFIRQQIDTVQISLAKTISTLSLDNLSKVFENKDSLDFNNQMLTALDTAIEKATLDQFEIAKNTNGTSNQLEALAESINILISTNPEQSKFYTNIIADALGKAFNSEQLSDLLAEETRKNQPAPIKTGLVSAFNKVAPDSWQITTPTATKSELMSLLKKAIGAQESQPHQIVEPE